ncbi:hypothetical protein EZ710_16720, partial [Salmonella enterica subsp. enterica serovar Livingstone]|nr:hypothetical protein [Salmonella enterica subsp. enterica serovar Livingstone]
ANGNATVIPDWQAKAEKMAEIHGSSFVVFRNGESPQCADPTKVIISFTDEGLWHGDTGNFRENAETSTKCWCRTCRPITLADMRFVVCPVCGNKRCPHANDHNNACTGSNEPGNSPAIPDGWVMVPRVPTTEMANAMLGVDGCSTSALLGALKLAIAAAPQQEAE